MNKTVTHELGMDTKGRHPKSRMKRFFIPYNVILGSTEFWRVAGSKREISVQHIYQAVKNYCFRDNLSHVFFSHAHRRKD